MNNPGSNPYFALEQIIKKKKKIHAEATAEKIAFALHFDGKITALWGTQTHVATADEQILKNGTAYITDLGMTGPRNGVIGAEAKGIIQRSREGLPIKIVPDIGKGQLNGIIITINEDDNKVNNIQRVSLLED